MGLAPSVARGMSVARPLAFPFPIIHITHSRNPCDAFLAFLIATSSLLGDTRVLARVVLRDSS